MRLFHPRTPEEYREISRTTTYRHPVRSAILTQIGFWTLANTLLVTTMWLTVYRVSFVYEDVIPPPFIVFLSAAVVNAIIYGLALGSVDAYLSPRLSTDLPLGARVLLKTAIYTVVYAGIVFGVSSLLEPMFLRPWMERNGVSITAAERLGFVWVSVPFVLVCNFVLSAIKQADRSFGPGVLPALLLGRYRKPVREKRIFMFMDLRSSTSYAEQLGHERYSAMIRDLFSELDGPVRRFEAEVYQYIGDEVVFTWNAERGVRDARCLLFYFAIEEAIRARHAYYQERYGLIPEFKAGLHLGEITAVEVGTIKREIAYHGDTINTAARIQGLCNAHGRNVLVSQEIAEACNVPDAHPVGIERIGEVSLKGRARPMVLHAVQRRKRATAT